MRLLLWAALNAAAAALVPTTTPLPHKTRLLATTTLVDRALDTLEDATLHLTRLSEGDASDVGPRNDDDDRATLVVLGSGWASHALIKVVDANKYRVVVVSPRNHFVFTPMLASAAVGTVEYRSMTESVRGANPLVQFVEGAATAVDLDARYVTVQPVPLGGDAPAPQRISYDALVVAVGSRAADANVPGARERCFALKDCEDARRLREAVGERFERAARAGDQATARELTFAVVGGGATGVELAGELSDFVNDVGRLYPSLPQEAPRVVLVHSGDELLPQFDPDLRIEALRALERRGVLVRLGRRVQRVDEEALRLDDGSDVPCALCAWCVSESETTHTPSQRRVDARRCAGTAPVPFTESLPVPIGDDGRPFVDGWLRVAGAPPGTVYGLGDAFCFIPNGETEPVPQTAQVAGQQGAYFARLLNRGYDCAMTPPRLPAEAQTAVAAWLRLRGCEDASEFSFLNLGLLAYVGGGEALSQAVWKSTSASGAPRSSREEPASPRHRASVASMAWRSTR